MEKWQVEIKLKLPHKLFKRKVKFTFEWAAWIFAWQHYNCPPEEFEELPMEEKLMAVSYGAALWERVKSKKKVFFSFGDIYSGLMKATREENTRIGEAMKYAQYPDWLHLGKEEQKEAEEETEKKN